MSGADAGAFAALISLTAFGASDVLRLGQLHFSELAHAAGADGVEVRGELWRGGAAERQDLAQALAALGLQRVYSSPQGLWQDDGALDHAALADGLQTAQALGAPRLKMAIGGFSTASCRTLSTLQATLAQTPGLDLVIENDQTASAGTLGALQRFTAACDQAGVSLGLTFDMGNWHWTGECPLQAAQALAPRVRYVHCKGVLRQPQRWVAVPLAQSQAPWRAVLRALPADRPWAIEYPLQGDDLLATTRGELALLRAEAQRVRAVHESSAWCEAA
ncbi:TIM barrel protein [Curvibacter sp. HBC61]|uniref:TIM barrel protein n=1 Tax=Curvibacter cyanobacteriorum TaxID=3026422 RepID=A0ABT5MSN7_9BURK|nr:TIM barrel protein [Curvibacter sp. HBC61]MDD0837059.1 TIM barrel protein [Curvibacter sp. HBC61]